MSDTNVQSTNESAPPLSEAPQESNTDVSDDNSIDYGNMEAEDGAEAVELCKQAKEAGKTVEEYKKEFFKNKLSAKKKPAAKPLSPEPQEDKKLVEKEKAPVKEANIQKYKVKANGQEKEVTLEELTKAYSLAEGARKTMQEGINARNQALEAVKLLKNKDTLWDVLKQLGHDPRKISEEYLVAQVEEEMLTPEELDTRNKLKKLQVYEEMEARQKKEQEEKYISDMKAQYAQDFEKDFTDALRKVAIPPLKSAVARVARKIQIAAKTGNELSPLEAAKRVKKEMQDEWQAMYGESDDETLYNLVGDKNSERILKHRAKQIHNATNYNSTPAVNSSNNRKTNKEYSWSEWDRNKYKK